MKTLHEFLDFNYGEKGDAKLKRLLDEGADVNAREDITGEFPLHVATRRRRLSAVLILFIQMLLAAGSWLHAPDQPASGAYLRRLLKDASPSVRELIRQS